MIRKLAITAAVIATAATNILAQNVTIEARNRDAESVFADLMRQTEKNFIYTSNLLDGLKVNIKLSDTPLREVLDKMFYGTGISYKIKGNNVTLTMDKVVKSVPRHTVSGFVREESSGEALVGATVYDMKSGKGTSTNAGGFYSLTLPEGDVRLKVQYVGFDPVLSDPFMLSRDKTLNVSLTTPRELEELVVTATVNNTKAMESTEIGSLNLTNSAIKATPVIFGESDVVKTLQLEPGVSTGIEGMAGMYVHGGDGDENLYMLDNIPIYQVNHFGGLFSAFNTEAIRNVDFYKSSFPAKYDGRLSSFMDVHTKDGSLIAHHGSFRLGLTSGAFDINGPIWKGRTTYSFALRRSWFDAITAPALAIANSLNDDHNSHFGYAFTDINAKVNHNFSDKSSAYIMFYYGEDYLNGGDDNKGKNDDYVNNNFYYNHNAHLRWGNNVTSAGWKYIFSPKIYGELTGAFSRYYSSLKNVNESDDLTEGCISSISGNTYNHQNNINDWIAKADFNWQPSPENKIDFGASFTNHTFLPTKESRTLLINGAVSTVTDNVPSYHANEVNFYFSDDLSIGKLFRVNAGLHYSLFMIDGKTHSGLSPRLSVRFTPESNFAIKAGYSRSVQYVHQLTESSISLPTDQWIPITGTHKPQTADQLAIAFYWSTPDRQFTLSVEGYYKWMKNLLKYTDDYYLVPPSDGWTTKIGSGEGRSKGIDFKVSKEFGDITGHISYSLLWADRRFPDKNKGQWFPARFDNRHKINMVLSWKINSKWDIGASWTGMSGNRMTLPLQYWNDPQLGPWHFNMILSEKTNNFRLPFYHRLDLSATRKTKNGYWTFSIYNAYCNMNVIAVRKDITYNQSDRHFDQGYFDNDVNYKSVWQYVRAIPIIPSVSYTWLF